MSTVENDYEVTLDEEKDEINEGLNPAISDAIDLEIAELRMYQEQGKVYCKMRLRQSNYSLL